MSKKSRTIFTLLICTLIVSVGLYQLPTPSNDREWTEDQRLIPEVSQIDNHFVIQNVRDFQYKSAEEYTRTFTTVEFDLEQVQTVDFVLSQFADWRGMAHAFVSFGIQSPTNDDANNIEYVAISVEIRKEVDESYSPFWGLLKQYELAYVIATETDVIELRTTHRNEPVFLYPMDVTPQHAQALLTSMMNQAHRLETEPEFYNTITNSCMSNLAKHVNVVKPGLIPFGWNTIFPGFSDDLVVELGLLSTESTDIDVIRKSHIINDRALQNLSLPFSKRIRIPIKE